MMMEESRARVVVLCTGSLGAQVGDDNSTVVGGAAIVVG